jgi:hypothetical protein
MFRNHPWVDTKSLVKLLGGFTRFTMSLPAVQATFKQHSSNGQHSHTTRAFKIFGSHAICNVQNRADQSRAAEQDMKGHMTEIT